MVGLAHVAIACLSAAPALAQFGYGQPTGPIPIAEPAYERSAAHDVQVRPLPAVSPADPQWRAPADACEPLPNGRPSLCDLFECACLARGYYLKDDRIQWSGLESTFGVEGVLASAFRYTCGAWETAVEGEFYLNQPFDRNVLINSPERASYAGTFEVDTVEVSQLLVSVRRGDLLLALGKFTTPFGRTHFPLLTNARLDAPFIRTESILWRETGALVHYQPGWFVADFALVNGCEDRDTNSSKAIVSRLGIEGKHGCLGASAKWQDGIGSDEQKVFNNHLGLDAMVRFGRFSLSGEVIYDEYGLRRPKLDPVEVTWYRSLYYRDLNNRNDVPITGVGYYLNLGFEGERWQASLNYGEFYPKPIGHPQHDRTQRRGIAKLIFHAGAHLDLYSAVMIENDGYVAQCGRQRQGTVALAGLQWSL
jgi:hypothetical protein